MATKQALSVTNISRHFSSQENPAVDDISLSLEQGEILAVVGESGSGKTTFLRLIAGLETPDSGSISIGEHIVANDQQWIVPEKRNIGFVFQDGALFPHLNSFDNVAYGLKTKDRKIRTQVTNDMFILVGLDGFQERYPHELSGGERQRLALARAMAPQPDLILLDEPFSSLDPSLRRTLREEIYLILRKGNATAIMVTHDTDDALVVGDRIVIFRNGQVEQIGCASEIYQNPMNGYCASLFGPVNQLPSGGKSHRRPAQMTLHREAVDDSYEVQILRIRDAGKHYEAIVAPSKDPTQRWTIYLEAQASYEANQKAWVTTD